MPFIETLNQPYSYVFSDNFLFIGGNWNSVRGNTVRGLAIIDGRTVAFPNLITSIQQQTFNTAENWSIYPNPNKGQFTIKMDDVISRNARFEIFDISGRMVYNRDLQYGFQKESINLNFLTPGTYVAKINSDVKRFIVIQNSN